MCSPITLKFNLNSWMSIPELQALLCKVFFAYLTNIPQIINIQNSKTFLLKFKYQIKDFVFITTLQWEDKYSLKYLIHVLQLKSDAEFVFLNDEKSIDKVNAIKEWLNVYLGEYSPVKVEEFKNFKEPTSAWDAFSKSLEELIFLSFEDRLKYFNRYIDEHANLELNNRQLLFFNHCMLNAKFNTLEEHKYFIQLPYADIYLTNLPEEKFKLYLKVFILQDIDRRSELELFERALIADPDLACWISRMFPLVFAEFKYVEDIEKLTNFELFEYRIIFNYVVDVIYNNAITYYDFLKESFNDNEPIKPLENDHRKFAYYYYKMFSSYDFSKKDREFWKTIYKLLYNLSYNEKQLVNIVKDIDLFCYFKKIPFITNYGSIESKLD